MAVKSETDKIKVLVNVFEPLVEIMNRKFDAACLKRDAYLDLALRCESQYLRNEVSTPNSDKAKRYISDNLKKLKLKQVSLMLSKDTVDLMNKACEATEVPRDAFINRFVLLLTAPKTVLNVLIPRFSDIELIDSGNCSSQGAEWFWARPNVLDTIQEFEEISPFWLLRLWIENIFGSLENFDHFRLYNYTFAKESLAKLPDDCSLLKTENAIGFNTFMSDHDVELSEFEYQGDINDPLFAWKKFEAFYEKEKQETREKIKQRGKAK
jgi:hypothetical protein